MSRHKAPKVALRRALALAVVAILAGFLAPSLASADDGDGGNVQYWALSVDCVDGKSTATVALAQGFTVGALGDYVSINGASSGDAPSDGGTFVLPKGSTAVVMNVQVEGGVSNTVEGKSCEAPTSTSTTSSEPPEQPTASLAAVSCNAGVTGFIVTFSGLPAVKVTVAGVDQGTVSSSGSMVYANPNEEVVVVDPSTGDMLTSATGGTNCSGGETTTSNPPVAGTASVSASQDCSGNVTGTVTFTRQFPGAVVTVTATLKGGSTVTVLTVNGSEEGRGNKSFSFQGPATSVAVSSTGGNPVSASADVEQPSGCDTSTVPTTATTTATSTSGTTTTSVVKPTGPTGSTSQPVTRPSSSTSSTATATVTKPSESSTARASTSSSRVTTPSSSSVSVETDTSSSSAAEQPSQTATSTASPVSSETSASSSRQLGHSVTGGTPAGGSFGWGWGIVAVICAGFALALITVRRRPGRQH